MFFQLHPESAAEHLLINSDVTKHGRANKPSTSCPEPGRNWMKDAYSASLYYIVQNYGPRQLLPWNSSHIDEHFILQLNVHIYTIICRKSVSRATFADCRSQFLLDRLGRCLKLIVSYRGTSSHEFASQFGLAFFLYAKNIHKLSRMPSLAHMAVEWKGA